MDDERLDAIEKRLDRFNDGLEAMFESLKDLNGKVLAFEILFEALGASPELIQKALAGGESVFDAQLSKAEQDQNREKLRQGLAALKLKPQ